jgi:hypothetical protein
VAGHVSPCRNARPGQAAPSGRTSATPCSSSQMSDQRIAPADKTYISKAMDIFLVHHPSYTFPSMLLLRVKLPVSNAAPRRAKLEHP